MNKIRAIVTAALAAACLVLTGCGGNDPGQQESDVAACKTAMKAQFDKAMSDPNAPSGTRPSECQGVDDATLERLAGEVMSESSGG